MIRHGLRLESERLSSTARSVRRQEHRDREADRLVTALERVRAPRLPCLHDRGPQRAHELLVLEGGAALGAVNQRSVSRGRKPVRVERESHRTAEVELRAAVEPRLGICRSNRELGQVAPLDVLRGAMGTRTIEADSSSGCVFDLDDRCRTVLRPGWPGVALLETGMGRCCPPLAAPIRC